MSNITEAVTDGMERFHAETLQMPDIVYLGEQEWHQMKGAAEPFVKLVDATSNEMKRAEFKRMKIYRVDARTFIGFGLFARSPAG